MERGADVQHLQAQEKETEALSSNQYHEHRLRRSEASQDVEYRCLQIMIKKVWAAPLTQMLVREKGALMVILVGEEVQAVALGLAF
ncbi:hypothetical protein E2C01_071668 [Portunus trituberculatus]|uniref:Uncharacterized protein n=1 Tax=Portunus trituberculatus TaxID=210409 RepID=A0A5B7HXL4_PORTR|nr:hypothetical protein [Portunus trituberculatus]